MVNLFATLLGVSGASWGAACDVDVLLGRAAAAQSRQSWEEVESLATEARTCDPRNVDAQMLLAQSAERAGDYSELADLARSGQALALDQRAEAAARRFGAMLDRSAVMLAIRNGQFREVDVLLDGLQATLDLWSEREYVWMSLRRFEGRLAECLVLPMGGDSCGAKRDEYERVFRGLDEDQKSRLILSSTVSRHASLIQWFDLRMAVTVEDWGRAREIATALQPNDSFYGFEDYVRVVQIELQLVDALDNGSLDAARRALLTLTQARVVHGTQVWVDRFQHRLAILDAQASGDAGAKVEAVRRYERWSEFGPTDRSWLQNNDLSGAAPVRSAPHRLGGLRTAGQIALGSGAAWTLAGLWTVQTVRTQELCLPVERVCTDSGQFILRSGRAMAAVGAVVGVAGGVTWVVAERSGRRAIGVGGVVVPTTGNDGFALIQVSGSF